MRQFGNDPYALGAGAQSDRTRAWTSRNAPAKIVKSVCPYCAVGCGQRISVVDDKIVQIEGDTDSPISRGRLCPKGSATRTYVQSPLREYKVKYRRPHSDRWESLSLDQAMDMIADRVIKTREQHWQETDDDGHTVRRTLAIGSMGGATLDNEENYLMKKLYTALGVVQVENQARI
jgi:formate dehydrogenase major subunit